MSMPVESITGMDDARLIELIRSAEQRLVVMAPGLSDSVATVVCERWEHLGSDAVKVILDVDPEVYRLGYGTLSALQTVEAKARELGAVVAHQPGVRMGLVATEGALVLYAPTPLLVEAGPRSAETTNAIRLDFVPDPIREEIGLGERGARDQRVGLDAVPPTRVEDVAAELDRNPPMKFDVARTVRVFNAQFEFVELEVTGCMISRKRVQVPPDLLGLAKDERTRRLLRSSFKLIDEAGDLSGNRVMKLRARIARRYLIPLKGHGTIVLRSNKESFCRAVNRLRRFVELFQKRIEDELEAEMSRNRDALVEALLPSVRERPPLRWEKFLGRTPDDAGIRTMLEQELMAAYGSAEHIAQRMAVSLTFKGVTYESLQNEEFINLTRKAIPTLPALHEEYDAAKAAV